MPKRQTMYPWWQFPKARIKAVSLLDMECTQEKLQSSLFLLAFGTTACMVILRSMLRKVLHILTTAFSACFLIKV